MAEAAAESQAPEVLAQDGPNGSVLVRLAEPGEAQPETPAELIGGKFKSQDDLLKAYQELEKKQGAAVTPPADPAKIAPPVEAPAAETPADARVAAEQAGVDFDALTAEFQRDGALSEDTLKGLESKGITRSTVENYVKGQQALAQQFTAQIAESVGGAENLTAVLQWATTGLSKAEIEAYNAVVDTGNPAAASLALQGIHAKYAAAVGSEPSLLTGPVVPAASGVKPYGSNAEIVEDMKNPKYRSDPAYRARVEARLAVSDL